MNMPETNPSGDYGGSGDNRRLSHPKRKDTWARISPYPFLNRRWTRRDWNAEVGAWQANRPLAKTNQESIPLAIADVIWFEVLRGTPVVNRDNAYPGTSPVAKVREAMMKELEDRLRRYDKPEGVEELSLYDALEALSSQAPLAVQGVGRLKIGYQPLPRDLDHWRNWIARRGPVAALIWVDALFRKEGVYKPEELPKATFDTVEPAAVVVAGYNRVFKSLESTQLVEDDFILRPAFPIAARGDQTPVKVKCDFAAARFLEGFGVTVEIAPLFG
jgi:hypothetical protein